MAALNASRIVTPATLADAMGVTISEATTIISRLPPVAPEVPPALTAAAVIANIRALHQPDVKWTRAGETVINGPCDADGSAWPCDAEYAARLLGAREEGPG